MYAIFYNCDVYQVADTSNINIVAHKDLSESSKKMMSDAHSSIAFGDKVLVRQLIGNRSMARKESILICTGRAVVDDLIRRYLSANTTMTLWEFIDFYNHLSDMLMSSYAARHNKSEILTDEFYNKLTGDDNA